jgi:cytidylate kinase
MIHITIDGPSGAGKSTVAKAVAEKLGIIYLDTGAIYRAFAYAAMRDGIDANDGGAVEKFLKNADIEVKYSDGKENEKRDIEAECFNEKKKKKGGAEKAKNGGIEAEYFNEKWNEKSDAEKAEKGGIEAEYSDGKENEKRGIEAECFNEKENEKSGKAFGEKINAARVQRVFCNKIDVTDFIREHNISKAASDISKHIPVRIRLSEIQREIAKQYDVVLDGRDAGTFVLPDANFKFFLTADLNERAERRYAELKEKGGEIAFEKVLEDMKARDFNDSNRAFAPLKKAEDAKLIDSTFLTADEVAELIIKRVKGI